MPVFKLHSTSFTIEGAEGDTSSSIMERAGRILYEWIKKKEIRFNHFTESMILREFPSLEVFLDRATYSFHGRNNQPDSSFESVSGSLLEREFAWGVRYKHEDRENRGTITAVALFVTRNENTVVCSTSLFFEGNNRPRFNTPPGYLLPLWQLGGRTYNTKSCSNRYYDFIQFGLSHVKTETIQVVDYASLTGFLADKERKITAVLIPEQDFNEATPETKTKIRTIAGRLAGSVEFFFLSGSYRKVRVHEPGMVFTRPSIQIVFPVFDWHRLERDQIRQSQERGLPPLEDGAITVADLSELLESASSPLTTTSATKSDLSLDASVGSDSLSTAMDGLRNAISELSARIDQWMNGNGEPA